MAESKVESKPAEAISETMPKGGAGEPAAESAVSEADPVQPADGNPETLIGGTSTSELAEGVGPAEESGVSGQTLELEDLASEAPAAINAKRITMLGDVNLNVKIELGRTRMLVEDVLRLGEGSVVELDKLAGDPVDVYANDRLVARGEVLVLNDSFCVRINEIVSRDPHRVSQG